MASFGNLSWYRRPAAQPARTYTPVIGYQQLPAGTYDPSLYFNALLANLGLGYSQEDYNRLYGTGGTGQQDLATSKEGIQRQAARTLQDLLTARQRGKDDYQTSLTNLGHQYDVQATGQRQSANAAGVSDGGALAQALAARTANQARDTEPLSTNYQRFMDDNTQAQQRLQEDQALGLQSADTSFQRGMDTAGITLGRQYGSNAIYQAGGLTQALMQAAPQLATNPGYAVGPDGGLSIVTQGPAPVPARNTTTPGPATSTSSRRRTGWPSRGGWGTGY